MRNQTRLRSVGELAEPSLQFTTIHGHERAFRIAGSGPAILMIHGVGDSSETWSTVHAKLAQRFTVIAPDLLGHGASAKPRGDYSLGAHAASIRDLLVTIGVERATIVGHSLGGGVAMQFFYQFPQRTERLGLISSGGLGDDVSPMLRAAALPGSGALLKVAASGRVVDGLAAAGRRLRERGHRNGVYLEAVTRALRPLGDGGSRRGTGPAGIAGPVSPRPSQAATSSRARSTPPP